MNSRAWTGWSFLALGLLTAALGIVLLALRIIALQRWTTVSGVVTESTVQGPDFDENYHAMVTLRWNLHGVEYKKAFNNWGQGTGREDYGRIAAKFPQGSSAPLLVNPQKPSEAFLEAGWTIRFLIAPTAVAFFGLVAAALGAWIVNWSRHA